MSRRGRRRRLESTPTRKDAQHDRLHRRDPDRPPRRRRFAYATDPEKLPSWQTNTVSARREDDGPYGLGSRLREVHRAPGGLTGATRLIEPLVGRMLRKQFAEQVATLKRVLEDDPAGAPA